MDRSEFRRLEKAEAKSNKLKNKQPLYEWGTQLENTLNQKLQAEYEKKFKWDLNNAIDCFLIAIAYTLHFSETTGFGAKRIRNVMDDIIATVDMFHTGEYSPQEYKEILRKEGIDLEAKGK